MLIRNALSVRRTWFRSALVPALLSRARARLADLRVALDQLNCLLAQKAVPPCRRKSVTRLLPGPGTRAPGSSPREP